MPSARLLIALVGSVGVATAAPCGVLVDGNGDGKPDTMNCYPDVADGSCVPMQSCSAAGTATGIPVLRGLCVTAGSSNQCWDACNEAHTPKDYFPVSTTNDYQEGIAMFVKQLRTGMRSGSCPGSKYSLTCNPGDRCTPAGLTLYRGMCVTVTGLGNQCLDMCNTKIPLDTFKSTPGKQAGTIEQINMVRAGRDPKGLTTCPGPSVWIWLWIPIVLCCIMGLVFGAWKVYETQRARKRQANKGNYREPDQPPFIDENPAQDVYQPQEMEAHSTKRGAPPMAGSAPMEQMPMAAMMAPENDPMPVLQPEPVYSSPVEVAPQPTESFPNLFGQAPGMLVAPQTVAPNFFPGMGSLQQPITTYSQPIMTSYPQAGSMALSQPQYAPRTTSAYSTPFVGSMTNPMTTLPPSYGAYGAYGAANTTVYPGTTSMRIG